jgi:hypothetical protein
METKRTKTEAELIATVANIHDAKRCLLFAERAMKGGMPALAAACEERAKRLKPFKAPGVKKTTPSGKATKVPMKTHVVAEQALTMLIKDYKAGLQPTTYGELARRCGFEGQSERALVRAGHRFDRCRVRACGCPQLRVGSRARGKRQCQRCCVAQRIQPPSRPHHRDGAGRCLDKRGLRQPKLGRRSTHRSGKAVRTSGTTSPYL